MAGELEGSGQVKVRAAQCSCIATRPDSQQPDLRPGLVWPLASGLLSVPPDSKVAREAHKCSALVGIEVYPMPSPPPVW